MSTMRLIPLALAATLVAASFAAQAQASGPVKVGLMLPYSGTFAGARQRDRERLQARRSTSTAASSAGARSSTSRSTTNRIRPRRTDNVNKLIKRDNVDVLVGTVHSGVAMAMAKAAKANNTLLVIPNAGADEITGPLCAANIVPHARSPTGSRASRWASVAAEQGVQDGGDDHLEVRGRRRVDRRASRRRSRRAAARSSRS